MGRLWKLWGLVQEPYGILNGLTEQTEHPGTLYTTYYIICYIYDTCILYNIPYAIYSTQYIIHHIYIYHYVSHTPTQRPPTPAIVFGWRRADREALGIMDSKSGPLISALASVFLVWAGCEVCALVEYNI